MKPKMMEKFNFLSVEITQKKWRSPQKNFSKPKADLYDTSKQKIQQQFCIIILSKNKETSQSANVDFLLLALFKRSKIGVNEILVVRAETTAVVCSRQNLLVYSLTLQEQE